MTAAATADDLIAHLIELIALFEEAKGNHPALAEVRAKIAAAMDEAEMRLIGLGWDAEKFWAER